ncbi:MAG TPA: type II toxin-antitoxin system HicB family antitoxin [Candidatus Paceibacterota bacterium]|nr:type II toxin-antitoxin system HicB family antitoxin [Candidatus Paceibacterota bacterium]
MRTIEDVRTFAFPINIEEDKDGFFAECIILPGCVTQGDTYEEAVHNIKEAIHLYVQTLEDDGLEIPQLAVIPAGLQTVEISV